MNDSIGDQVLYQNVVEEVDRVSMNDLLWIV